LLAALDVALEQRELVKVRLEAFKDQKRALPGNWPRRSASRLVMEVGHVVVLFRPPTPAHDGSTADPREHRGALIWWVTDRWAATTPGCPAVGRPPFRRFGQPTAAEAV